MKRDNVDEILMRYFAPAADAGDLAGRVLQAARDSARQTTRLLDSLSIQTTPRGVSLIRNLKHDESAVARPHCLDGAGRQDIGIGAADDHHRDM